jgi:oxygen-independent coproporphyrinogen-3 oxidase
MRPRPASTRAFLDRSPYQGYVYAYPHKTAYRRIDPAIPLTEVWREECRESLFLYVHIPFCGMRCGFCNLFTQAKPDGSLVELYLDALERQAAQVARSLGDATFSRLAVGGGTPSYLSEKQLERLFDLLTREFGVRAEEIPVAVEVSPETITPAKVELLKARGVHRVSMGIQSFIESETANCGRPQKASDLENSLRLLTEANFPVLNLDLIYGLPGQTEETWEWSLSRTLDRAPREIYLYPLYVRPLTGLGRSDKEWDDVRLQLYRQGRNRLLDAGYEQISMRFFRKPDGECESFPRYCCQTDGMLGLGCGARSYTRSLHTSSEYAVGAKGIREILRGYVSRDDFSSVDYGTFLDEDEQRRRYLLQSLLQSEGLIVSDYRQRFGTSLFDDFPELRDLEELGLARVGADAVRLTDSGLERSDAIGPSFFSDAVRSRMGEYELR